MSDTGTGVDGTIIAGAIAGCVALLVIGCLVYLRCYSPVEETIEEERRKSIDLFGDDSGGGEVAPAGGPPGLGGESQGYGSPAPPTTGAPGTFLKTAEDDDDDHLDV